MMRYGLSCSALLVLMPLPVVCTKEIDRGKDSDGTSALKTFGSRGFIETSGGPRCNISINGTVGDRTDSISLYQQVTG